MQNGRLQLSFSSTEVIEGLAHADNPAHGSGAGIAAGKGAVLNPAVREIKVVDLLKAPDPSALPTQVFQPETRRPMPTLKGALAFRVQVAPTNAFTEIVQDQLINNGSADFESLPIGDWFARVRGIDGGSLEGFDSLKRIKVALGRPAAGASAAT